MRFLLFAALLAAVALAAPTIIITQYIYNNNHYYNSSTLGAGYYFIVTDLDKLPLQHCDVVQQPIEGAPPPYAINIEPGNAAMRQYYCYVACPSQINEILSQFRTATVLDFRRGRINVTSAHPDNPVFILIINTTNGNPIADVYLLRGFTLEARGNLSAYIYGAAPGGYGLFPSYFPLIPGRTALLRYWHEYPCDVDMLAQTGNATIQIEGISQLGFVKNRTLFTISVSNHTVAAFFPTVATIKLPQFRICNMGPQAQISLHPLIELIFQYDLAEIIKGIVIPKNREYTIYLKPNQVYTIILERLQLASLSALGTILIPIIINYYIQKTKNKIYTVLMNHIKYSKYIENFINYLNFLSVPVIILFLLVPLFNIKPLSLPYVIQSIIFINITLSVCYLIIDLLFRRGMTNVFWKAWIFCTFFVIIIYLFIIKISIIFLIIILSPIYLLYKHLITNRLLWFLIPLPYILIVSLNLFLIFLLLLITYFYILFFIAIEPTIPLIINIVPYLVSSYISSIFFLVAFIIVAIVIIIVRTDEGWRLILPDFTFFNYLAFNWIRLHTRKFTYIRIWTRGGHTYKGVPLKFEYDRITLRDRAYGEVVVPVEDIEDVGLQASYGLHLADALLDNDKERFVSVLRRIVDDRSDESARGNARRAAASALLALLGEEKHQIAPNWNLLRREDPALAEGLAALLKTLRTLGEAAEKKVVDFGADRVLTTSSYGKCAYVEDGDARRRFTMFLRCLADNQEETQIQLEELKCNRWSRDKILWLFGLKFCRDYDPILAGVIDKINTFTNIYYLKSEIKLPRLTRWSAKIYACAWRIKDRGTAAKELAMALVVGWFWVFDL
ncbi:hypothetical protein [Pyrobaculum neutrophilum]|uniref:Uncharacterized protein n=1 Tax=Pyrobaculum neutrophilum (strain DSM 2338 / JCM 9278 / NBRC 100436 / V24Sta) TaxID=444157 RepID=B1YE42_PYRNV|nr:hypothetical protein [Pyrobaculum neutrophilum]ACB40055.1 hypothetical protein Tneu_1125 [Pyrobaculum neutrophilum V24Sta]